MDKIRPNLTITQNGHRLLHGRGGGFVGWESVNIDFYPPVAHISLYAQITDEKLNILEQQLKERLGSQLGCIILQRRYLKNNCWQLIWGELPSRVFANEGPAKFILDFVGKQNIGFFPDMLPGREWLIKNCKDKKILNLFSYTCALSVIALNAGARHVLNVDMSRAALNTGRENHRINQLPMEQVSFRQIDIMKSLGSLIKKGPYDLVIIDPPSFQKGSFDAKKDYVKIIRRLDSMLRIGGKVMACLNSPHHDSSFLRDLFSKSSSQFQYIETIYRDKTYKEKDREKGLKILIYEKLSEDNFS